MVVFTLVVEFEDELLFVLLLVLDVVFVLLVVFELLEEFYVDIDPLLDDEVVFEEFVAEVVLDMVLFY